MKASSVFSISTPTLIKQAQPKGGCQQPSLSLDLPADCTERKTLTDGDTAKTGHSVTLFYKEQAA